MEGFLKRKALGGLSIERFLIYYFDLTGWAPVTAGGKTVKSVKAPAGDIFLLLSMIHLLCYF